MRHLWLNGWGFNGLVIYDLMGGALSFNGPDIYGLMGWAIDLKGGVFTA